MITVKLNDQALTVEPNCSLQNALELHHQATGPVAVALNGEFVPRTQYNQTILGEGDTLDVVSPVGGG